jgi:Fe-Mn family superoxide dismutase
MSIPEELAHDIAESASSVESLKQDFLAAANAMFGPGFVWLVKDLNSGLLRIVCTYNAGSPYPGAHARRQAVDMNTQSPDGLRQGNQHAGFMGDHSSLPSHLAPGAINAWPILCVNTWQHVWMMDYGIAGKEEYLERWWDRVNWESVHSNYKDAGTQSSVRSAPSRQRSLNL